MRGFLTLLLVLGLVGAGLGYWYWNYGITQGPSFRTVAVERGNLLATISATGTIEPEEVIDVGAQVAGQIKNFGRDPRNPNKAIDYGSAVEEGTVLAQIDEALYKAQVDQAKANVQRAEADLLQMQAKLRQADREWKRARDLGPRKVIADVDYDTAQANYETAKSALAVGEASIVQAKANLNQAEINLGYTTIKSPVKGVIVDRRVNVGQTVVASLNAPSLFLIAKDLKRMQVWASVNEADIGNIHKGQVVQFTVDAFPNETFRGEVDQIRLNANMTQNVVTYTVVVNTDNSSGKLLPYLTANLQFQVSERSNVLKVANAALRWRPQPQIVAPDIRDEFVKSMRKRKSADPEEKAAAKPEKERQDRGTLWVEDGAFVRPVKVRIGLTDGTSTEIVGGDLKEGMELVVGEARQNNGDSTTNPFTPKMFGGGNKAQ
jgi:HlyD family secretion protein